MLPELDVTGQAQKGVELTSDKQELSDAKTSDLVVVASVERDLDAALVDRVESFLRASKAKNTTRAYRAGWGVFAAWCSARGFEPLPARPAVVAAFLADVSNARTVATLSLYVASVRHAHEARGFPTPTRSIEVGSVMQGIRRTLGQPSKKKTALLVGDVRAIVGRLGDRPADVRDRALLLVGFAGGFRRSELVALDVADVEFCSEGVRLSIRRSKTDQTGSGRMLGIGFGSSAVTCPIAAVRRWLALSAATSGPLFRAVDRGGRVLDRRLGDRAVAQVVQRLGRLVGLDARTLGGHSLRSGFATSAASAGVEERDIARVTGHRSIAVLRGYVQAGTMFEGDLVRRLGL